MMCGEFSFHIILHVFDDVCSKLHCQSVAESAGTSIEKAENEKSSDCQFTKKALIWYTETEGRHSCRCDNTLPSFRIYMLYKAKLYSLSPTDMRMTSKGETMSQDDLGMQTMQAEEPQRTKPAAEPVSAALQTEIRRKPNAAAEVINGTVIEAEIETRMRKKMLRKYLLRIGAAALAVTVIFLHFFGSSLLSLLTNRSDDTVIRTFKEPVCLDANPELMELMYKAAMKGGKDFSFDTEILRCNTAEQAFSIMNASYTEMLAEHPEIFFLGSYEPVVYYGGENGAKLCKKTDIKFHIIDECKHMPLKRMLADMQKTAKNIVSQAPRHGSDYDKALFVHDYLVNTISYDIPGSKSDQFDLCYTAYGALEDHSAVCQGYACAYAYLMRLLDIDCKVVAGEAKVSGTDKLLVMLSLKNNAHAWNYIELDGKHYWTDVTWDDPLYPDGTEVGGPVKHNFCFIDDDTLFKSHKLGDEYKDLPPCNSMKLNDQLMQADQNAASS